MPQTNNSHFKEKIALRIKATRGIESPKVLDAYAGTGAIWKEVQRQVPEKKIVVLPIEKVVGKSGAALYGDNRRYLSSLDLSQFDIIDLDAYGIPTDQLTIVKQKGYEGIVIITAIHAAIGQIPHKMLDALYIDKSVVEKAPSLFTKHYEKMFWGYLYELGFDYVDYIVFRNTDQGAMRKIYCSGTLRNKD